MSTSIDNRVVGLQFDNKNFEKNVGRTLNSLDKLEESLQLKGAGRGLEQLDRAASRIDFSKMGRATELITRRLSTMGLVGMNVLNRISNKAISTAERMLKAFTIQPINDGFSEYELKMGSVQTIVASTGESLATVNAYLEELNKYSDKTIYSFKDMTASIGKFTNAGVPLEQAVLAIQGISNEAAVSGANAEEASRAMYNFSQALSAGYVKLIDWKSIENANMATREFKQELINTAVAMGTLKTANNGLYRAGNMTMNATKNFNDSLQKQWMTSEVLIETLRRYADETTDIGKKAFAAAQDIKTFHQLLDTIKESIGSGWAQISEIIFGDLEEAKELWTSIGNAMSNFVDKVFGGLTKFLGKNLQSNYKKFMSSGALTDVEKFNDDYKKAVDEINEPLREELNANNEIIRSREESLKEWEKYYQNLRDIEKQGYFINQWGYKQNQVWSKPKDIKYTAEEVANLTKRNEELNAQIDDTSWKSEVFKDTLLKQYDEISEQAVLLNKAGYSRSEAFKRMGITKEQFDTMMKWRNGIRDGTIDIEALVASFDEVARRKKIFNALGNTLKFVGSVFKPVSTAFKNVFFNAKNDELWLGKLVDKWDKWAAGLKISDEVMKKTTEAFEEMFGWVYKLGDWAIPKLKSVGKKLVGIIEASAISVYHFISAAIEFIDPVQMMNDALEWITKKGAKIKAAFHDIWNELKEKPNVGPVLTALQNVYDKFNYILDHDVTTDKGKVLTKGYQKFWYALKELPVWFEEAFKEAGVTVKDFVDDVKEYFKEASESSGTALDEIYNNVSEFVKKVTGKAIEFGGWLKDNLDIIISGAYVTLVSYRILKFVSFLDSVLGSIEDFARVIDGIGKAVKNAINRIAKAVAFEHRAKGLKAFGEALKAVAEAVLIISASIWILSKIELEPLKKGVSGLAAIIILLGALAVVVAKFGDAKGSLALGSIAFTILAIAYAADLITKIKVDDKEIGKTLALLAGIFVALGLTMAALYKMKTVSKEALKSAFLVGAAVFSLYAVVYALKLISEIDMDWPTFIETSLKMLVAFGLLFGMMKILSKSNANMGKAGAGLLAMALSVVLIIGAFKLVEKLKPKLILKGLAVLYLIFKSVGVFMDSIRGASSESHKAAAAILAIGLAILPLVAAVAILGKLDIKTLEKGVFALAGIMVSLGLVMLLAKKFEASFRSLIGLVAVITTLGLVIGGLSVLAHYVGMENVIAAAASLATVFGVVAGLFAVILHFVGKTSWTSFGKLAANMGVMLVVVGLLALMIYGLSKIEKPYKAVMMTTILGEFLAELTVVLLACTLVGSFGFAALKGLGLLAVLIIGAGVVLAIAAGIGSIEGAQEFFNRGLPILRAIGEGIGQFVGGMIGGTGIALMEDVVKMTESLEEACTNITAASDALDVQDGFGSKLAGVAGSLAAFTGADFLEALNSFLTPFDGETNETTFDRLGKRLRELGEALAELSNGMGTVKLANITTAGVAGEKLAGVLKTINGFGIDINKLTEFSKGVKDFALAIGVISRAEMTDVDNEKIEAIAKAGERLGTMGEAINEVDGIDGMWQKFWGKNDAATFGANIKSFAEELNKVPEVTLTDDTIKRITSAGVQLGEMAKSINEIDGIDGVWQKLWGKTDAATFGTNIKAFAGSIQALSTKSSLINEEGITKLDTNTTKIIELAKEIVDIDSAKFYTFTDGIDHFIGWYNELTISDNGGIVAVLEGIMSAMIDKIVDFADQFKETGGSSMDAFTTGMKLRTAQSTLDAKDLAKNVVGAMDDTDVLSKARVSGQNIIDAVKEGMESHQGSFWTAAFKIAQEAVRQMENGAKGSVNGGGTFKSISDSIVEISDALSSSTEFHPVIRPVLDLSDVRNGIHELDGIYDNYQVGSVSNDIRKIQSSKFEKDSENGATNDTNITFNQYNTSPKALSRIDIYRQTKNQISQIPNVKGVVKTT